MLYEVINPSDKVTLETESEPAAIAAVLLLGRGKYGLSNEKGETVVPIFLLGGYDAWAKEKGYDLGKVIEEASPEIAKALESSAVCSLSNRSALKAALGDDPGAVARWNEAKRTSMNDLCGAARSIAKHLRENLHKVTT